MFEVCIVGLMCLCVVFCVFGDGVVFFVLMIFDMDEVMIEVFVDVGCSCVVVFDCGVYFNVFVYCVGGEMVFEVCYE